MEILYRAAANPPKKAGQAGAQKTFLKLRVLPCFAVAILYKSIGINANSKTPFFGTPCSKNQKQVLEYGCKMGGTQSY